MNIQRDDVGIVPYGNKLYTVASNYPAVGTGVLDCPFMVNFTRTVWNEGPYKYNCLQLYTIYRRRGRCPHRPVVYSRADVGIRPYNIIIFISPINYNLNHKRTALPSFCGYFSIISLCAMGNCVFSSNVYSANGLCTFLTSA